MRTWFVTGTDTEVGKTVASCALVRELARRGHRVAALKPVASGCDSTADGLRNEDALSLMRAANLALPYELVNPCAYEPPIAPHLAAMECDRAIDLAEAAAGLARARELDADWVVVEGVGGWSVPLGPKIMLADLARAFTGEVVLVVGLRLGCINHALLTAQQVRRDGFRLVGWIANDVDPAMDRREENLATLEQRLSSPLLARLPWSESRPARPRARWFGSMTGVPGGVEEHF
jgi:dethiobiotin synthetase